MNANDVARLIKEKGETQAAMARFLNISADKFNKSLKGIRQFTPDELDKMARYFNVMPERPRTRRLPIVGLVAAGAWREGFEAVRGYIPSPDLSLSDEAFVVQVDGDSMNLVAKDGELIIVEPRDRRLVCGRYYVVRNSEGEMTFKRYMDNPARLEPVSDDPAHCIIYPGQDGFEVIGRATQKVSNL
jgi:repressor LexA